MVCFLALAGILVRSNVTLQSDALTLRALVQELAAQSGQKIECDGILAKEPLCVDFRGQSLDTVMANLALVVGGEWRDDRGVRVLTRPSKLRKQLQADESRTVSESLSNLLKKSKAEIEKLPPFNQAMAKKLVDTRWLNDLEQPAFMQAHQSLTTTNLAYRTGTLLANTIGAVTLCQMPVGARAVYSDVPTKVQVQFPKGCDALLAQFNKWSALMMSEKRALGNASLVRMGDLPQIGSGDIAQYRKLLFAVRRNSLLSFTLELVSFDQAGDTIIESEWRFPSPSTAVAVELPNKGEALIVSDSMKNLSGLTSDVGASWASGRPFTRSDGTKTFLSYYMSMSESQKVASDWRVGTIISDPVKNEPLGYVFGPLIRQVSLAAKKPMIATIGDGTMFTLCRSLSAGSIKTTEDVLAFLTQSQVPEEARVPLVSILPDDGWILVRPARLLAAQSERFDRLAAREFIQSIQAKGGAAIEDALRYVRKSGVPFSFASLDYVLISHATPSVEASSVTRLLSTPIELLMKLDGFANDTTTFGRLKPEARAVIEQWVYSDPDFRRELSGGLPGSRKTGSEPTEVLPNGIPSESEVAISNRADQALIGNAESGYVFAMQPEEFAWHESLRGKPLFGDSESPPRKFKSFRPATQRDVTVTLRLTGPLQITRTLRECLPVPGSNAGEFEALPKEVKQRIDEARAGLKSGG